MGLLKSLGLRFEHDLTEDPGHAVELAKSAARIVGETGIVKTREVWTS